MKTKYRVLRPHDGDRFYQVGETRVGNKADLKHLVPNTLEEIGPDEAEDAPATKEEAPAPADGKAKPAAKAEGAAPQNKSEKPARNK